MMYYIVSVLCLLLVWCPYKAINVSVQYNGGLLPDIILVDLRFHNRSIYVGVDINIYALLTGGRS